MRYFSSIILTCSLLVATGCSLPSRKSATKSNTNQVANTNAPTATVTNTNQPVNTATIDLTNTNQAPGYPTTEPVVPGDWQEYYNDQYFFSLQYPPNWQAGEAGLYHFTVTVDEEPVNDSDIETDFEEERRLIARTNAVDNNPVIEVANKYRAKVYVGSTNTAQLVKEYTIYYKDYRLKITLLADPMLAELGLNNNPTNVDYRFINNMPIQLKDYIAQFDAIVNTLKLNDKKSRYN